ncbi:hypothetical protein pb186bvf_016110 [Paramecium bursaria]
MKSLRGGGVIMTKFSSQQPTVDLNQVIQVPFNKEEIVADIDKSIQYILDNFKSSKALNSQLMREFRKLFQLDLETQDKIDANYIDSVKLWIEQLLPLIEYLINSDGDLCLQLVDYISVLFKNLYTYYTSQGIDQIEDEKQQQILEEVVKQKYRVIRKFKQNETQKYIYHFIMIEFQIFEEVLAACKKSEIKEQAISVFSEAFKSALKLQVSDELISSLKESFFILAKASQNELKKIKLDIILKIIRQTKIQILGQQKREKQIGIEEIKQNLIKLHKTVLESENWEIRFCWIKMIGELINYRDTENEDFKKLQLQLLNGDGQGLNNYVSYSNSNFKTLQTRNSDDEPLLFDYKEQILRLINFFESTHLKVDQKIKEFGQMDQNLIQKKDISDHQIRLKEFNKYFRSLQQQLQLVSEITTFINFCCLRAKMLQQLFDKSKVDKSEIFYSQQLIFIDKILQHYKVNEQMQRQNKNQTIQIKSFVGNVLLSDIVKCADLIQKFNFESLNQVPKIEQIIMANKWFSTNQHDNTRYQPKADQSKYEQLGRIFKRISNFRGQNLINSFEIDQIIQKIEQIIIYIDLIQQIRDHNYNEQKVEEQLIKKSLIIASRLKLFQYKQYNNLIDNFDYLNQISNTINILDIQELDKDQIKYCFDSIQNLCDFHINYFLGAKRILCFQNLRINEANDIIMVISRLQSKFNQLNHYQRQTLRSRQSFSKLSLYINDFIQEENLSQFKYSFDFEQFLDKDKFLLMVKQIQKDVEQAIDNQEQYNDQICEQFITVRTYLLSILTKLNEYVIPKPSVIQNEQKIEQNDQQIIQQTIPQTKYEIKLQKLTSVRSVVENLINIVDQSCQKFFSIDYSKQIPIQEDLVKEVIPFLQTEQNEVDKKKKKYIYFQYQFQSIKQQSERQIYQSLITRYIKQLKIIKNLILIDQRYQNQDSKQNTQDWSQKAQDSRITQNQPFEQLQRLIDQLSKLKIQVNNFDDLLENSTTDLNYYFRTHLDINNEDAIKPILLKIVKSICKNRNYEQIEIQYKATQPDNVIQKSMDKLDGLLSEYLVTISSTNKAIKIPTAYYILMASSYQNTASMATKILTRLSVLETDSELIEIYKNSTQLKEKFAEYWKEEEQQIEQVLLDSIQKLKELQFQISTTNSDQEKQKYQLEYQILEKEVNQQITQIDDLQKNPNFQVQALFITQIKSEMTTLKDTLDKITKQLDFIMQDVAYLRGKSIEQLFLIRMNNVLQLKQINDIKCIFTPVKTKERNFVNKQDDPLTDLYEEIEEYFELDTMKTSMLIHGQAGSGKSTASRKIEELLWDKFNQVINDKKTQTIPVVPILIQLPQLKDPLNSAVEETLKSDLYRFNNKQINEFKEQVEQGKWRILFIFDSYDELKSNYIQTNILIKNRISKWKKLGETQGFPKCITTSRTEIFKSSDYHEWFWSETKSFINFKEIQLSPFNKEAVKQYLDLYTILKLRLILIKYFQRMYIVGDEHLAIIKLKSFIQKLSSLIFQNQQPGNLITSNQANNIIQDLVNQYSTLEKQASFDNLIEQMFVELIHIWNTQQYLFYINELKLLEILETPFIMELVVQVLPQIVEQSLNKRNLQQKFVNKIGIQLRIAKIYFYQTKHNMINRNLRQKWEVYEMIVKALSMQQIYKFLFYENFIDEYFEKQINKQRDLGEAIDSELFKKELWQCGIHIAQNMLREQITILDYQPQGFLEQGGLKKNSQKQSWKYRFFDDNDVQQQQMKKLIRACLPLKSRNQKFSFNHKSILEFLAAFDVIQLLDSRYPSYFHLQESVQDHFINSSNFSTDFMKGTVGFIIEKASKSTYIQTILTQIVLLSCIDENFIAASSNATFLLNQMQFQFCKIKYNQCQQLTDSLKNVRNLKNSENLKNLKNLKNLENLKIQDVNLEGINFYNCNLDNSRFMNVKMHNCNLNQATFMGAQWTNIESDCIHEKVFDKDIKFFRFNTMPYIYDNQIIQNQEQKQQQPEQNIEKQEQQNQPNQEIVQIEQNKDQKENIEQIKSQIEDLGFYNQLLLTKQVDQLAILEDERQDIWVLTKQGLDLHVQKYGSQNSYYMFSPLYKCDKVFFPKAGSIFYYKKDLQLIIKHSYTQQKFNLNPTFMIKVDDQNDVVDVLHPYDDMVILIQMEQQKTKLIIYRFYLGEIRYIKQLLVTGILSDIRFFDNYLSMVLENCCVKILKINQIKSIQELQLIQTDGFKIPLDGISNEQYINFINKANDDNIKETQRLNELKQQLLKDKNDEKKEPDQEIQSDQNNAFSWQLVFDTQKVSGYKNYFIKDNLFYLVAKKIIVYDLNYGKQLYFLNIQADYLSVHLIQDKLLMATVQILDNKSVLRIFNSQPEAIKQIQEKSVHAMSYDGQYLAYQINSVIQFHRTNQFNYVITLNLSEPADMIGFCKMNSSFLFTFFVRSKILLVWNIHTLELVYNSLINLEKFYQIFFIRENYFEFYDKNERYSYSIEDQKISLDKIQNKVDIGNSQITFTQQIIDHRNILTIKKVEVEKLEREEVTRHFDGERVTVFQFIMKINKTLSFDINDQLNLNINDWYFFKNVNFFISKQEVLMMPLYQKLTDENFSLDNQHQLFILEQNSYFILISGFQLRIVHKQNQFIDYDFTPRSIINCSADKNSIYLFFKTFDFAIYQIIEVDNTVKLIQCYSTFKEINKEPLNWIK